jgi:FkbM family methyltransferase
MDINTGDLSEQEVMTLAERLAWRRPLVPYPGWRFASAWENPLLAFRLRAQIVEHVKGLLTFPSLPFQWHYHTRVNLELKDDGGQAVFIGGCIEPNELAFVDRFLKPGMTCIDAGANMGLFTLLASRKVGAEGTVWAFEPSYREYDRLTENLRLSQADNVQAFSIALLDREGEAPLSIADGGHTGQNTLGAFVYAIDLLRVEVVRTSPLDQLVRARGLARVDLMNIDVEGAELALLAGAAETLKAHRPVLLLEVLPSALEKQGTSRQELLKLLQGHQYNLFCFDSASGLPRPATTQELENNVVAVPAEKGPVSL